MEDEKPGWVDKKLSFSDSKINDLESQLTALRYATNAEISYHLSKQQPDLYNINKSILDELVSVKFSGGHGYICADYLLKNGTIGKVSDTSQAVYLIDYAKEKGIYER